MYSLDKFFGVLDKFAPLSLSEKLIACGDYDNSGILLKVNNEVKKVLFSLDLSVGAVKRAKHFGVDTIVTHHPAIYSPIKNLSIDDSSALPILMAIKENINVISMHLNLDVASFGIDAILCQALGGENYKIVEPLDEKFGYGREFKIEKTELSKFVNNVKKNFNSRKILFYGKKTAKVEGIASFCGAGSSHALKALNSKKISVDTIVTSDAPHHVIKEIVEKGINLVLIPHYVAEEKGFRGYFENISKEVKNFVETYYFDDKRFR